MREINSEERNGRDLPVEETDLGKENETGGKLADIIDVENDPNEDDSETKFKFRDRRFWVDEDDSEDETDETSLSDKPTYVQKLEERVKEAEQRLAEYVKAYKEEVQVEWERTKERLAREYEKNINIEKRRILGELLEVLDMLEMSLDSARKIDGAQGFVQGIEMVGIEFEKKLFAEGMKRVAARGESFDPRVHEAVSMEETDDPSKDGKIVEVFKNGYVLGEELVRPALVAVARVKQE